MKPKTITAYACFIKDNVLLESIRLTAEASLVVGQLWNPKDKLTLRNVRKVIVFLQPEVRQL